MVRSSSQIAIEALQLLIVAVICSFTLHAYMQGTQPRREEIEAMIEAEDLNVNTPPGVVANRQNTRIFRWSKWSSDMQLYIGTNAIGQSVSLTLPAIANGTYDVLGFFTRAKDYGIIQNYINDEPVGEPVDLYSGDREVRGTGRIVLGRVKITSSPNVWTLKVVGVNSNSINSKFQMGLDGIIFVPAIN